MKRILLLIAATASILIINRAAQADQKNDFSDEKFLLEAASGGILEVKLGELAAKNAESADVRTFAKRMVDAHTQANVELIILAKVEGVTVPKELQRKHQDLYDKLKKLQGAEFDRAYMKHMVADHEEDIAQFKKEAADGKEEKTKAFASKTLPTLKEHLKLAREVAAKVGITEK
jgi:putative membrane protein